MNCRGMNGEMGGGVVFCIFENDFSEERGSVIRRVHDVCGVFMTGIYVFFVVKWECPDTWDYFF